MSEGSRPSPEITAFIDGLKDIIENSVIPDENDLDECAIAAQAIWNRVQHLSGHLIKHERRRKDSGRGQERRTEAYRFGLKDLRDRGFGSPARLQANLDKAEPADGQPMQWPPPAAQSGEGRTTRPPARIGEGSINLTNASVGQPYEHVVPISGWRNAQVEGGHGSDIDVTIEGETVRFGGIPHRHGSFEIRVSGLLEDTPVEMKARLWVNPDPRSLWRNEPSNQQAPYAKPDEAFAICDGPLFGAGASKRGRSHAHEGLFRDDDFGLSKQTPSGWQIAVVADGAGSAPVSRRGSQLAVETILERLPPLLDDLLGPARIEHLVAELRAGKEDAARNIALALHDTIVESARQAALAIEREAEEKKRSAGDFSTTLIVCIARRVSAGWFFAGFSIGDGGAAVLDAEGGTVKVLAAPDSGEFAGQTKFLHSSEFEGGNDALAERVFFDVRDRFSALFVMTDGITDPKLPTESAYTDAGQWRSFWQDDLGKRVDFRQDNAELKNQLLGWLDFWSPGNHDDRTLVVLVPGGAAGA